MMVTMKPNDHIIAEAIDYLVAHYNERPVLDFLARRSGYEPTYFQKLFKSKVGISPRQLIHYMNMRDIRDLMGEGMNTIEAAHYAGLTSPSRVHYICISIAGVSPGSLKTKGAGLQIVYGFVPTILGEVLLARTDRGICWFAFLMNESREIPLRRLHQKWPNATVVEDQSAIAEDAHKIRRLWGGADDGASYPDIKLDLYGTNFQVQVWQALLQIPYGQTVTYSDIAHIVGRPAANRAVGNAVGANPVSALIPCHRVIRATGIIDNYAWGSARKKLLLSLENNHHDSETGINT